MDIDNFDIEIDEDALAEKLEAKLLEDEQSIARPDDNDCGGSCSI